MSRGQLHRTARVSALAVTTTFVLASCWLAAVPATVAAASQPPHDVGRLEVRPAGPVQEVVVAGLETGPVVLTRTSRAVTQPVGGQPVRFATAEDLILHKLFAGRPRDLEDVRGVLARKGGTLDRAYLRHWAREFSALEEKRHLADDLERLLGGFPAT